MSIFRFKEFVVDQTDCAMKINTDGVLLGATANTPTVGGNILDIGTGTGVVALMLAQRFKQAKIQAIEIDAQSASLAGRNFQTSHFHHRLDIFHGDFQDFITEDKFDLIVSNPPFYLDELGSPDPRLQVAKHANQGFFEQFFTYCRSILSPTGTIKIIVRTTNAEHLIELASRNRLRNMSKISISSFPNSRPIRSILSFQHSQKENKPIRIEKFYIYKSQGNYSAKYRQLLTPFLTIF